MSRFVRPETKVLKISQGDTLTVKRKLNAGEQRAAFSRMAMPGLDGAMRVNSMQVGVSLMVAYLVDWSLVDDDGNVVEIRDQGPETIMAALDALDAESYSEIKDAIEAHDAEVRTAREQEKKGQGGAIESPAISPSPVSVTGVTSGSVN